MSIRPTWFALTRHDDDGQPLATDPPPSDPPPDPGNPGDGQQSEDGDALGDKGKKALDAMKAERAAARRDAAEAKAALDAANRRIAEFEDRDKSELERAQARADAAEKAAAAASARAVQAEVRALAAVEFADPTDAQALLDLSKYVGSGGEIDSDAIGADLAELLERKPHLRKTVADPQKKLPRPDPSQGARPPAPPPDYRTADRADVEAALSKYGVRLRR